MHPDTFNRPPLTEMTPEQHATQVAKAVRHITEAYIKESKQNIKPHNEALLDRLYEEASRQYGISEAYLRRFSYKHMEHS